MAIVKFYLDAYQLMRLRVAISLGGDRLLVAHRNGIAAIVDVESEPKPARRALTTSLTGAVRSTLQQLVQVLKWHAIWPLPTTSTTGRRRS